MSRYTTGRCSTLCASVLVAGLAATQVAAGAEITQRASDNAETTALDLKGRIERGDLLSLQALISKLPHTKSITVYLDSTTGSLDEALALGRFFHQAKMRTVVDRNPAKCLVICALPFLGGRDAATGKPWRMKTSSGQLGFYSFVSTAAEKPEYTDKDMTGAVVDAQRMVLRIADYIQEIRDDLSFLQLIFKRSDAKMNLVSNEDALKLGIYVLDERSGEMIDPKVIVDRVK
jgi:hypothetical protein